MKYFCVIFLLFLLSLDIQANVEKKLDPCALLTNTEIQVVQGQAPEQSIATEQPSGTFRFTQCYFRTPEFSRSVSVAVGHPLASDDKRFGPRQYWQQQFHKQVKAVPGKKKEPPRPIAGLGDEAYWAGDPMSGALYVLKGAMFLRVSVGGPGDQAEKIKRAKVLASHALKRLQAGQKVSKR